MPDWCLQPPIKHKGWLFTYILFNQGGGTMKEINAVTLGNQVYPVVPNSGNATNTMKGKQSFDSFLNTSSSASTGSVKAATASKVSSAGAGNSTQQPADAVQKADTGKTQQPVQDNSTAVTETGTDSAAKTVTDAGDDVVSEAAGVITAVNNVIQEAVKDITGLDDEALAEIMEVLGMQFVDLLDMGNLKQFVMYINNTSDVTDLLMDESMTLQLNNLADVIADIDIEAITGMAESDFAQLLQDMADGNLSATDNGPGQTAGAQQAADIPVTAEYEEDVPAGQKEAVQAEAANNDAAGSTSKETAQKDTTGQADNGRVQAGGKAEEGVSTIKATETEEGQGNFKQGTESQTGSTLAESTQTEARPVREEALNGQTGFIHNLAQAAVDVQDGAIPQKTNIQTMINIVNQVVEQIKVTMGRETTSMQLQLNPESLGKVLISVTANHGVMTANFTVQSEEAKEALQSQMFSLREALESRNLKVDAVEVEVSDFAFSQSGQADAQDQKEFEKGNGRRFRFDASGSGEEEGADVDVSGKQNAQRLDMGSSIDFTA